MKTISKVLSLLVAVALVSSCSKKDPVTVNEEEVITTVIYKLTPTSGGSAVVLKSYDKDGDGPVKPVITGGELKPNTTYNGVFTIKNETKTPAENVTEEIKKEEDEHQFFFSTSGGLDLSVAYADKDGKGKPVGLTSKLTTKGASSGKLKVILKHKPNKSAAGVSEGKVANAGGSNDVDIEFPVTIK